MAMRARRLFLGNLICVLGLCFGVGATATEVRADCGDTESVLPIDAQQWDVVDLPFEMKETPDAPFDVAFSAKFVHESGATSIAPGFYNGEQEFLIRWSPPQPGAWQYETKSDVDQLNHRTGQLTVSPAGEGRSGGIRVDSQTPTRFQYANGEPYFPIAFEVDWLFALDAENPSDIPVTRKFVETMVDNGFNQVVMNVFAYDVNWPKDKRLDADYDYGSPSVFPFGGNNTDPNYDTLSVEYFQRLDRVIELLDQKGIAAHLMIYVWNKRVNWPEANSEADNRYFDYVVDRYQAYPNMVWDISKEALGYGHNDVNYISERIERLRERDHFQRLITVHDYSYCRRFTEKVDFVSVQLWTSELFGVMRRVSKDMPGKPILNIEHGGYERSPYVVFNGNYTSPEVCLERAWQCVFAGTFPTHYWQGAAWNVIIADIGSLPESERPRLEYYRHMREFVDQHDVVSLKAGDSKSNAGFCLHNGEDRYIYYVPKECEFIGIRMPKEDRGKTMTGTWFNPYTGQYDDPIKKEIVQWPAFDVPEGSGFRILIVDVESQASESKD